MTLFIAECDSELWDEKDQDSDLEYDCDNVNSAPIMPSFGDNSVEHEHANNLVLWFIGFFLSLQAKFYFPDSAIDILIKFLYAFIRILSGLSRSTFIDLLSRKLPCSLYVMLKKSNVEEKFTKYVVCSNCCDIYSYEDCVSTVGQHKQRKDCISVKYPDHPQRSRRKPCGELLLKSVHFVSGKKLLYPIKVYAYKSLKESLQSLLLRPNFYSCCQEWRIQSEFSLSGCLEDIYAGNIWNDYQQCMGSPFLSEPYSLAFVLNVDWFQPYTHTTSSVGVIYLTVLNLPRTVRYKRENVILVGIIPGPHEPKENINAFLQPLVDELRLLWKGMKFSIQMSSSCREEIVRCAILCVSCDIPDLWVFRSWSKFRLLKMLTIFSRTSWRKRLLWI